MSKGKAVSRHPVGISFGTHRLATGCNRTQYGTEVFRMWGECRAGRSEVQELWKHYWLMGDELLRPVANARVTQPHAQNN